MQCRRVSKKLNTSFAVLYDINEVINNHIFRKGFNALGLSSALIGSGMAFNYKKLKTFLSSIIAVGGFDKELQLLFIENHIKIQYLENAIVFDEKIDAPSSFAHQRRRWLSSQYIYFKKYLQKGISQLLQANISYFNIAVLYNLFPTRSLTIISLCVLASVATLVQPVISISYIYWWLLLVIYISALLFAIPKQFYNKEFLSAILKLPYALLIMIKSLFRLKGADKQFIHTKHTRTEIDKSIFYSK
jgi:cellulose synthase/poly-beta-1,6-N-acetylglucosamine synthase-like glycosyltransferase